MVDLNRKQRRAADSILRNKDTDLEISKKFKDMCKIAHKNNMIIFGEKTKLGNGIAVDFTHFDFMLSIFKPSREALFENNLLLLKEFWITFYPFLSGLAETAQKLDQAWHSLLIDQKAVLAEYANLDYRDKKMSEFFSDKMEEFERWFKPQFKKMKEEEAILIEKDAKEIREKEILKK